MDRFKIYEDGQIFPLAAAPLIWHMEALLGSPKLTSASLSNGLVLVLRLNPAGTPKNEVATAVLKQAGWKAGVVWGPALVLPASDLLDKGIYTLSPPSNDPL